MTDLEIMQQVAEWPHLAGLPLKRKRGFNIHNQQHCGLLVCPGLTAWPTGSKPRVLIGANVWNPDSFRTAEQKEYETLEEVAAEWLVD